MSDIDAQAIAIECAAKYDNVALAEFGHPGAGFASLMVEISVPLLPSLLEGIDVSHIQLMPCGQVLQFVMTRPIVEGMP